MLLNESASGPRGTMSSDYVAFCTRRHHRRFRQSRV